MAETSIMRARGQITIPDKIRQAARLEENDPVTFELTPDGILLKPHKMIDSTQAWFWAPEWQAGEREADAQREAGEGESYATDDAFLAALRERRSGRAGI